MRVIDASSLDEETDIYWGGQMGSPTTSNERLQSLETAYAVRELMESMHHDSFDLSRLRIAGLYSHLCDFILAKDVHTNLASGGVQASHVACLPLLDIRNQCERMLPPPSFALPSWRPHGTQLTSRGTPTGITQPPTYRVSTLAIRNADHDCRTIRFRDDGQWPRRSASARPRVQNGPSTNAARRRSPAGKGGPEQLSFARK